jgi:hypothetical protein
MTTTTCYNDITELLLTRVRCCACVYICRLSPDLLGDQWLQQHEARLVQQLQGNGWTGRNTTSSSSSSRAAPGTKSQPAVAKTDKQQLQASVRSAAAAGLTPCGACALLSMHEECGYIMRSTELQQVCLQMAAAVQG